MAFETPASQESEGWDFNTAEKEAKEEMDEQVEVVMNKAEELGLGGAEIH